MQIYKIALASITFSKFVVRLIKVTLGRSKLKMFLTNFHDTDVTCLKHFQEQSVYNKIYTMSQKTVHFCFCHNFVKFR